MAPRVVIFSDTHLTHLPDKRKLRFLLGVLDQADTVIINGDFWDSSLTTANRFAHSPHWQALFKALREKQAVYLYGNHDTPQDCKGIEDTFSTTHASTYLFHQGGHSFQIEHGNRIAPDADELYPRIPRFICGIGSLVDGYLTAFGKRWFLNSYKKWNEKMKKWQSGHLKPTIWLICGHSHFAEVSPASLYANSGSIRGGLASYLIITEGTPVLHRQKY